MPNTVFIKTIQELKEKLEELNKILLNVSTEIMKAGNNSVHNLDLYFLSVINRAIALNKSFTLLLENDNSLTSVSIVRLQLDNVIRLNAIKIVENREDFLNHFFEGNPINTYRVGKQKLTDNYLATELNKNNPGVLDLYKFLCDFIHFSRRHFDATKEKSDNEEALYRIVIGDFNLLNHEETITFYENMLSISNIIDKLSIDWTREKNIALGQTTY